MRIKEIHTEKEANIIQQLILMVLIVSYQYVQLLKVD